MFEEKRPETYEKDIRDIVEYFERKKEQKGGNSRTELDTRSSPEIARSQKIESLIKKVAENKNRARFDRRRPAANQLQVRGRCLKPSILQSPLAHTCSCAGVRWNRPVQAASV